MGEPMRVAQVLNRMESGGIEAVVMNYYRHMDHKKIQFDFYFFEGSSFPQRQELEQLGAGIYPIPAYSHALAYHRALYQAFKSRQYQIVHAHLSTMSAFALYAAWRAGVPVRICHNHTTAHWSEGKKTLLKYILRPFNKLFATDWFACGERAGRWMYGDRAFDEGRVRVIPNAIDAQKFAYDPIGRDYLRKELGIPEDAFVLGHIGRFTAAKNHDFLLKVFSKLIAHRPNARLLLVGQGELEQKIRTETARLGLRETVIFAGVRNDMQNVYSAMDVFCMPSIYEGFPLAVQEAQANGLPCMISDRITKEVVLSPAVHQLPLHGPEQWEALARQLSRRADGQVETGFDLNRQAQKMLAFYLKRGGVNTSGAEPISSHKTGGDTE